MQIYQQLIELILKFTENKIAICVDGHNQFRVYALNELQKHSIEKELYLITGTPPDMAFMVLSDNAELDNKLAEIFKLLPHLQEYYPPDPTIREAKYLFLGSHSLDNLPSTQVYQFRLDNNTIGVKTITSYVNQQEDLVSWEYNDDWDEQKEINEDIKRNMQALQKSLSENQFNIARDTIYVIERMYNKLDNKPDLAIEFDYLCAKTAAAFQQYDLATQLLDDYFSRSQEGNIYWIEARRFKELLITSQDIIDKGETLSGLEQAQETIWITSHAVLEMYELSEKIGGAMILKGERTIQVYCKPGTRQDLCDSLLFRTRDTKIFDYVEIIEAKDENELAQLQDRMDKQIISDTTTNDYRKVIFQILE